MKTSIKTGIIAASFLASSLAFASQHHHGNQASQGMMGDPAQMQKMMEDRMKMMKSELKLNAEQEKAFDAFARQKQAMMQEMMKNRQAMMKNMKGSQMGNMQGHQGMQGGQMGNMQGQGGMMMGGMMQMMSSMSFEQRLKMMQDHGEKMLATARAGKKFYNSLSSDQKKKLNDMPKKMKGKGMNMSQMQ